MPAPIALAGLPGTQPLPEATFSPGYFAMSVILVWGVLALVAWRTNKRVAALVGDAPAFASLARWNIISGGLVLYGACLYVWRRTSGFDGSEPLANGVQQWSRIQLAMTLAWPMVPAIGHGWAVGGLALALIFLPCLPVFLAAREDEPRLAALISAGFRYTVIGLLLSQVPKIIALVAISAFDPMTVSYLIDFGFFPASLVFFFMGLTRIGAVSMYAACAAAQGEPSGRENRAGWPAFLHSLVWEGYVVTGVWLVRSAMALLA